MPEFAELPDPAAEALASRAAPVFVQRVPIHFARRHVLLGLSGDGAGVEVVTDAPEREPTIDNLALTLACPVRVVRGPRPVILDAIDLAYGAQHADLEGARAGLGPDASELPTADAADDLLDNAARGPVVKLVNTLLFDAVQRRASDVHLQPSETELRVRLRVDGVLFDHLRVPRQQADEIVSRVKVVAGMDIAEKRLPQDGRSTVRIGRRLVDLRIATVPTAHGERVVLRLLDKGARAYTLTELGMAPDVLAGFQRLAQRSHGLLLMTGPTGSGKSTTLYALLQHVDHRRLNVLTLEDPIEYQVPEISQTQVNERKGMTFASGLRSLLRQDPDVIMVGEIRDQATARLAVQSALTGHLVLSTLHTNDAVGAVARLLDLGIEPYLVADALLAVGAQRLVRLICPQCRAEARLAPELARELGLDAESCPRTWTGTGCAACGQSGYRERQGIFELLLLDDELRRLIHGTAQASALRAAAARLGMRTLRQDGARKILAGLTTAQDVLRVTQRDERSAV